MEQYQIFLSHEFEDQLSQLENGVKNWANKIVDQLIENPFVGKPLGRTWFREKKFGKYRAYYIIYETQKVVYVVKLSEKKNQQKVINSIRPFFDNYYQEIEKMISKNP